MFRPIQLCSIISRLLIWTAFIFYRLLYKKQCKR